MATKGNIIAVHCNNSTEMKAVFGILHKAGYNKDGLPLFNVWVHDLEFDRGIRHIMVYDDSKTVKVAVGVDRRNTRIKVVEATSFKENLLKS